MRDERDWYLEGETQAVNEEKALRRQAERYELYEPYESYEPNEPNESYKPYFDGQYDPDLEAAAKAPFDRTVQRGREKREEGDDRYRQIAERTPHTAMRYDGAYDVRDEGKVFERFDEGKAFERFSYDEVPADDRRARSDFSIRQKSGAYADEPKAQAPERKRSTREYYGHAQVIKGSQQKAARSTNKSNEINALQANRSISFQNMLSRTTIKNPPNLALIVVVVCMLCFGLVMLYSASMTRGIQENESSNYFILRQGVFTFMGIIIMGLLGSFNVGKLDKAGWAILYYLFTLFLLTIVLVPSIGRLVNGQRRWLPLPFAGRTGFQPSEIAKIGVIFCLAVYFSQVNRLRAKGAFIAAHPHRQPWLDGFIDIFVPSSLILFWCLLISLQSHMSAVIIILFMTFVVFSMNQLKLRSWICGGLEVLCLLLVLLFIFLAISPLLPAKFSNRWNHVVQRINIFTESDEATEDDLYQTEQAEIAIGSGGWTGLGLGNGRQKYNYLPENHNDYIFSSIVEELGFLGGLAVIALFLIYLYLGLKLSLQTNNSFDRSLAGGFTFLICIQGFLNIAVNVGAVPPTGISLPFFSYGGSANLIFLATVGVLLSISRFRVVTRQQLLEMQRSVGGAKV